MNADRTNAESGIRSPHSKAVFLDRDGCVCEEVNYLSHPDQLKLFSFAAEAIRFLNENNFLAILITNQSGIARGVFDEKILIKIHERLISELRKDNAKLDAIYFCPHLPKENCACRKPKIGLIEQATKDFEIDLRASWMVGDKAIDVKTGFNAKLKTALVLTGYGQEEIKNLEKKPTLVVENLLEAVKGILKEKQPQKGTKNTK